MATKKDRTKAALVKRLSEVRIVEIACKSVGISRATYYRWLKEDVSFAYDCEDAMRMGTETICDLAESQIVSKIRGGDFRASTYFLEKHHDEYKPLPKNQPPAHPQRNLDSYFNEEPMGEKQINFLMNTLEALKEKKQEDKKAHEKN
jgi:hypothetical protein